MKALVLIIGFLCFFSNVQSQQNWVNDFNTKYYSLCTSESTLREYYLQRSATGDASEFMGVNKIIATLTSMYVVTKNDAYLNDQIKIINNILSTAAVSKTIPNNRYALKDDYMGWISQALDNAYHTESVLFEGYAFRYIVQFLYEIKKSGWTDRSVKNREWYESTLHFVEKNVWEKWIKRSIKSHAAPYKTFLSSRTHKASHWAHIGLFLKELTIIPEIKTQCQDVINMFDLLMHRNLVSNAKFPDAYTWNSTWDNVNGTQAETSDESEIQDVNHGGHVMSYIVNAKRQSDPNWTNENMQALCNTVKKVMFRESTLTFSDNVDGTASISRPGWGNYQSEGWAMLGLFDEQTHNLYLDFARRRFDLLEKYSQEIEYYAGQALIEYLENQ